MATAYTSARFNLEFLLKDIDILLATHEEGIKARRGRPAREHDIFKRAALILLVTGWESFIEDTLASQFKERLDSATEAKDIDSTFKAVAQSWIETHRPTPNHIRRWTGDGWKRVVRERFDEELGSLNTPNARNIRHIFRRYLGVDVTRSWRWAGVSSAQACKKLDAVITLRGNLVHRSKALFDRKDSLRKKQVTDARNLIDRLAQTTEVKFAIQPNSV